MNTGGLATAVRMAGGVGDLGLDEAEQLDLIEGGASLPLQPAKRGVGRRAGVPNRATEEARQWFLRRYKSPLQGLGEIYSRSAEDLARELALVTVVQHLAPGQEAIREVFNSEGQSQGWLVFDRLKAFDRQMAAMNAALPYVERKQPIAIDAQGKVAGVIVIGDMDGVQDDGNGMLTLDLEPNQPSEQNQGLSNSDSVRPETMQSHAEPNTLNSKDKP